MFKSRVVPIADRLSNLPWWALVAAVLGVLIAWSMATDATYQTIFSYIATGVQVTIRVTIISYVFAVLLALIIALGRVSSHKVIQQTATFYVEIVRGVPTLVLMLYVVFVVVPLAVTALNSLGATLYLRYLDFNRLNLLLSNVASNKFLLFDTVGRSLIQIRTRNIENEFRVIVALIIAYSAFVAEVFRAGIESVENGQMEAARALGMGYWQTMRHVILRQAIRRVLPPLGNDFISMLKDSSLVAAIGVYDITRLGQNYASRYFVDLQTFNVVAFLYLVMTLFLSMLVKLLERQMSRERTA